MEFFLCNGIKSIKILKIQFKLEEPKWHWNPSFNISNQMWLPNPLNFSKELFYLFNKIIYGEVGIYFYFFSYSYNFSHYFTNFLTGLTNQELVQFLNAFNIVSKRFDENLHHELRKTFVCLTSGILTHVNNLPRFLASRCLASLASFMPNETITAVINYGKAILISRIF